MLLEKGAPMLLVGMYVWGRGAVLWVLVTEDGKRIGRC